MYKSHHGHCIPSRKRVWPCSALHCPCQWGFAFLSTQCWRGLCLSFLLFAPESLFPNQRGLELRGKPEFSFKSCLQVPVSLPLATPLHLPHQWERGCFSVLGNMQVGFNTPTSSFCQLFQATWRMHLSCCFPSLSQVLIILHFHPCPAGCFSVSSDWMVSHDWRPWSNVHLLYAQKAMKAGFSQLYMDDSSSFLPCLLDPNLYIVALISHGQVFFPSFSQLTSRNQQSDWLRPSCGHGNQRVPSYQCLLQRDTWTWSCQLKALQKGALVSGSAALYSPRVPASSCRGCCLSLISLPS